MKHELKTDYDIEVIADGVYKIDEFGMALCYLITGSERALLIDTGTGLGDLKGAVEKLTSLPVDVVGTHAHPDHIGGIGQWGRAYIHKEDIAPVYRLLCLTFIRKALTLAGRKMTPKVVEKGITPKDVIRYKQPEIIAIEEGKIFDLGGRTVKVINVPGHTRGSVALLLEELSIMFTGDDVNPLTWLYLPGCVSLEEWLPGAERLLKLAETYKPFYSHDLGVQSPEQMAQTIAWVKGVLAKQKKNTLLYKIRQVPEGKDLTECLLYRTNRVYKK